MSNVQGLRPVLKMGSVRLPFASPDQSVQEALQMYAANYPHLANATVSDPVPEGEELVYEVQKPPVKTKG